MVEVALGLILFLLVVYAVVDMSWLFYHYISMTQSVKATARFAGTNTNTAVEIEDFFYRRVGPTKISSSDGLTTFQINRTAVDPTFASLADPGGFPSVQIVATYDHDILGPWPVDRITLTSTGTAMVITWTEEPTISF